MNPKDTQNVRVKKSTIELIDDNRHCNTPRSIVIDALLEQAAKTWKLDKADRSLVSVND